MIAVVKGKFMECGKGYTRKDGLYVPEIIVYSHGETIRISNIDGKDFTEFEDVSVTCKIRQGSYGLNVVAVD